MALRSLTLAAPSGQTVITLAELEVYDPRPRGAGPERDFLCPLPGVCQDKTAGARHRSLSANLDSGLWRCHRCTAEGQFREYWRPRAGGSAPRCQEARRAFAAAPPPPALAPDDLTRIVGLAARLLPLAGSPAEAYLHGRAIPPDLAAAAGVLYAPDWWGRPAAVFAVRDQAGQLVALHGRHSDGRDATDPEALKSRSYGPISRGVFATPGALAAPFLAIAEAPIDALSLAAAGIPALALCGTGCPAWLPPALAFRDVALATDADDAGDQAASRITMALASFGARVQRWRPAGCKDWNEALRLHGAETLRRAFAERIPVAPAASPERPLPTPSGATPTGMQFPAAAIPPGPDPAPAGSAITLAAPRLRCEACGEWLAIDGTCPPCIADPMTAEAF